VVISSYFLINLFFGVVIYVFQRGKGQLSGATIYITQEQTRRYIYSKYDNLKPMKAVRPPTNRIRNLCYLLVTNKKFINGMYTAILINAMIMPVIRYG